MATLELVEKLRERASVTYDEAREALDASGDDLLDAMIYLEQKGKVDPPPAGGFHAAGQPKAAGAGTAGQASGESTGDGPFVREAKSFLRWCGGLLQKSCTNLFEVWRGENRVLSLPVFVLILLVIFCFWVAVPLLLAGLFCGCRYRFAGTDLEGSRVNRVMDRAAETAEDIKSEIVPPKSKSSGEKK